MVWYFWKRYGVPHAKFFVSSFLVWLYVCRWWCWSSCSGNFPFYFVGLLLCVSVVVMVILISSSCFFSWLFSGLCFSVGFFFIPVLVYESLLHFQSFSMDVIFFRVQHYCGEVLFLSCVSLSLRDLYDFPCLSTWSVWSFFLRFVAEDISSIYFCLCRISRVFFLLSVIYIFSWTDNTVHW
jgi:hypothetical protein